MNNDRGVAIATEYVMLLGISLLIFTAIFVGLGSFSNTATADARAAAAFKVAALVSQRMSGATAGQASVIESVELPGQICGLDYVVYPSVDDKAVCVLVGRDTYEAPVIVPDDITIEGYMVSEPDAHRIEYEASTGTLTLT